MDTPANDPAPQPDPHRVALTPEQSILFLRSAIRSEAYTRKQAEQAAEVARRSDSASLTAHALRLHEEAREWAEMATYLSITYAAEIAMAEPPAIPLDLDSEGPDPDDAHS